jgi:hypothetical protein
VGECFDRSEWPELMEMQDKNHSSPLDWHKDCVNIMDQQRTNFCWCFGTCAGIATQYAKTGITPPEFSPASTACMIKNFANEGGWGSQACNGVQKYGIATTDTWPNVSFNRALPNQPKVREDMHLHDLHEFEDLGQLTTLTLLSAYCWTPIMRPQLLVASRGGVTSSSY